MKRNLSVAIKLASVSLSFFAMVSCGKTQFSSSHKDKRNGAAEQEQAGGSTTDQGCLNLGNPNNYPNQNPGQNPDNGYDHDGDVVVVNPGNKGDEPPPPPPSKGGYHNQTPCDSQGPGQNPCQSNCGKDDGYRPIDTDDDIVVVQPYPTQQPIIVDDCGKGGKYCYNGPGQWPSQTVNGGHYDQRFAQGCFEAFARAGYNPTGLWNIQAREMKNVNVLGEDTITDFGTDHALVIIKNVSVLGRMHFELLNPNALYCIQNVSVLDQVLISSCHSGNVVWGKDVNVLSSVQTQPVACQ